LRKFREREGAFLVEGADLVAAGLVAGRRPQAVFVLDGSAEAAAAAADPAMADLPLLAVNERVATRISTLETPAHVMAMFPLPQAPELARLRSARLLAVYADRIADPGNLGTLMRAAAGFGATALITSPDSVDAFSPKVVRGLGDVVDELGGPLVYGLAAHGGTDLHSAALRRPAVLCVGAERAGLSEQASRLVGEMLTIPLASPAASAVESLNAGVAGAIALYEFARRGDPQQGKGRP
jgi:TrmH family RNA methyltransferase